MIKKFTVNRLQVTGEVEPRRGFTSRSEKDAKAFRFRDLRATAKQTRFAFTLIETLVAISVLLLSLAGPLSIAASALKNAHFARDEVTAYYLAQEAIEYVRAIRDQNFLNNRSWLEGLDETSAVSCIGVNCSVDIPNFTHALCGATCPFLKISASGGLYNHSTGADSIYRRSFTISRVDALDEEATIMVTVTWQTNGLARAFTISENIFHWLK